MNFKFKTKYSFAALGVLVFIVGCVINFKSEVSGRHVIHVDTHYRYPGRNEASTSDRYYKKEVQPGRFAQSTDFSLDDGQQILVLNKAFVYHFYQMPDTFYHAGEKGGPPAGQPQFLRIWADTLDKTVHWNGSIDSLHPSKFQLKELVEYVDSIARSTDAYKSLPEN